MWMPRDESPWARVVTPISRCSPSIQDEEPSLALHRRAGTGILRGSCDDPASPAPIEALTPDDGPMTLRRRVLIVVLLTAMVGVAPHTTATADTPSTATVSARAPWFWPFDGVRSVANPYRAPAHRYGAGHRGIDIVWAQGDAVRAPADGIVAFRGTVVDRPLLTIEHPGGYVSTFEPVSSPLSPGDAVTTGDEIGTVAAGGHAPTGTMHLGVRRDGDYINPMLLFGEVPRAVLLPCCDPL